MSGSDPECIRLRRVQVRCGDREDYHGPHSTLDAELRHHSAIDAEGSQISPQATLGSGPVESDITTAHRYQASAPQQSSSSAMQHVTAVFMFLLVNTMVTVKRNGLFTDGGAVTLIMFGTTPGTLFQGAKDALSFWPMMSINLDSVIFVISIPEILLLILARFHCSSSRPRTQV